MRVLSEEKLTMAFIAQVNKKVNVFSAIPLVTGFVSIFCKSIP